MPLNLFTRISKNKATEYLQSCIDAYLELKEIGRYSLLKGTGSSLGENFNNVFVSKTNNPELILIRDYDGSTDFPNNFTVWNIPRSQRSTANFGGHVNPTLNLVESFETINSGSSQLNAYVGNEIIESMGNETSAYNYVLYDSPMGIFEGRDPRLWGTVILPGADFRGKEIQLQAGLAVKTASGYDLKMLDLIENVYDPDKNFYNGQQLTSIDGPIRNSYYTSHTGFLLRKYIDPVTGSEASGKSAVPYIIFRYGEILLNAAEAAYYLNQLGVANYKGSNTLQLSSDCLNEVRERAGGTAFRIESSDLTLALLQNERKIELAFEDHRFYDLKRWRIADQIWSGDWNTSTARMTGLWPYKVYAPGQPEDGKWLFRRVYIEHRGNDNEKGLRAKILKHRIHRIKAYPIQHYAGNDLVNVAIRLKRTRNAAKQRTCGSRRKQTYIPRQFKPERAIQCGTRAENILSRRADVEKPRFVCKKNGETAHNQRCRFDERVCKLLHPQCTASPCKEVFQHRADRLRRTGRLNCKQNDIAHNKTDNDAQQCGKEGLNPRLFKQPAEKALALHPLRCGMLSD